MNLERPEYPETKQARWRAWACAVAALVVPLVFIERGMPDVAPYAFAALAIFAAYLGVSVETDRLHRRIDAIRDGD
jgi:hypothetical protein